MKSDPQLKQILTGQAYRNYANAINSPQTLSAYDVRLLKFCQFAKIDSLDLLISKTLENPKLMESNLIEFIVFLKNEKDISHSFRCLTLAAIKKFMLHNDCENLIRWNKVKQYLGVSRKKKKQRGYTKDEIRKVLEICHSEKSKIMILLMASSGMRIGALASLKVSHFTKVAKYNLYQITVYENEPEEYHTFCTPECAAVIDLHLEYRKRCGEIITANTPLFRKDFDKNDSLQVKKKVEGLTTRAFSSQLASVLLQSGLRETEHVTESRGIGRIQKDVPRAHGFRKFFDTTCTLEGVNPAYVEFMMGHSLPGSKDSYFIPPPDKNGVYMNVLEGNEKSLGYTSAIDALTINEENKLRQENIELRQKVDRFDSIEEQIAKVNKMLGLK